MTRSAALARRSIARQLASLPIRPPYPPMEAQPVGTVPAGSGWQYEPKWDGFRCLAFRAAEVVELQSKSGRSLTRYFPEIAAALADLRPQTFVLDGELVVPRAGRLSFDDLLQRIHPAATRIRRLAAETPALLIAFDLLVDDRGQLLADQPLARRRARLERFAARHFERGGTLRLSPATSSPARARAWFETVGEALDGLIAKRVDQPYAAGERTAMVKLKHRRTAECVVGGFRYAAAAPQVGSLLLGLYDEAGLLHHVGFTSAIRAAERPSLTARLRKLIRPPGFTGSAPGGPSRWARGRDTAWEPLAPRLVVEVEYDHFTGGRFRHGTRLARWRPDKDPRACTLRQVAHESGVALPGAGPLGP